MAASEPSTQSITGGASVTVAADAARSIVTTAVAVVLAVRLASWSLALADSGTRARLVAFDA